MIIVLIALVAALLAGCGKDWLELPPTDGVIKERFWNTKEDVYNAVIGCYQGIIGTESSPGKGALGPIELMFAWGELRADNITVGTLDDESIRMIVNGNLISTNKFCGWATVYTCINYCNQVVYSAPSVQLVDRSFSDAQLKGFQGEARAIRSLMYLNLVKVFGDIAVRFDPSEDDNQQYVLLKQLPELQVLDTLEADLLVALAGVPETYGSVEFDKGRITKNTVRAILADLYLWAQRYDDAVFMCNQIITSNKFALFEPTVAPIWMGVEADPGPGHYDLATQRFKLVGNMQNAFITYLYNTQFSTEALFELTISSRRYNPFTQKSSNLMMREDGNNVKLLASPKVWDTKTVFGAEIDELTYAPEIANGSLRDIRGENTSFRITGPGYLIWKFRATSTSGSKGQYGGSWYVYRYADVLLMKAEAIAANPESTQENLQAALQIVLDLRSKRNALVQTYEEVSVGGFISADVLSDFILNERQREFIFEGKRWFDLVRYARRSEANMSKVADMISAQASGDYSAQLSLKLRNRKAYNWPILNDEIIRSNGSLKQNPFYL